MAFEQAGTAIGGLFGGFGKIPPAPDYVPIEKYQKQIIEGNIAAVPKAGELVGAANVFNQAQLEQMGRAALGSSLFDAVRENIGRLVRGELTAGEQKAIQRTLSAKSFGLGVAGTPFATGVEAFGLSAESLRRTQIGISSAAQWLGLTRAPTLGIEASFLPVSAAFQERDYKTGLEWLRNQLEAAPDPGDAAMTQAWINAGRKMDSALLSMTGMMAGGAFGGGGGGGMAGGALGRGGGGLGVNSFSGMGFGSGYWSGYSNDMMGGYVPSWK